MATETITAMEFGPELAGERVGWVAFTKPENPELAHVAVDVVVGTVDDGGARYGYFETEEGERLYSGKTSEGLIAVTALRMLAHRDEPFDEFRSGLWIGVPERRNDISSVVAHGVGGSNGPEEEAKRWADSQTSLLQTIRDGLTEHGVADNYPGVYYGLNTKAGQYALKQDASRDIAGLLLADPDMSEMTHQQVKASAQIGRLLTEIRAYDHLMLRQLTVFGDASADLVPTYFRASRRQVADKERATQTMADQLVIQSAAYLPVGSRPYGRTWPYMDPMEADEDKAFGRELRELEAGKDIDVTYRELQREIGEVEMRLDHARRGHAVLLALSQAEAAK